MSLNGLIKYECKGCKRIIIFKPSITKTLPNRQHCSITGRDEVIHVI